jgi:hypothetical protein
MVWILICCLPVIPDEVPQIDQTYGFALGGYLHRRDEHVGGWPLIKVDPSKIVYVKLEQTSEQTPLRGPQYWPSDNKLDRWMCQLKYPRNGTSVSVEGPGLPVVISRAGYICGQCVSSLYDPGGQMDRYWCFAVRSLTGTRKRILPVGWETNLGKYKRTQESWQTW